MPARVLHGLEPDAGHALARQPFVVLRRETDHSAALGADEVGHRDADGPAELTGLGDDLIGRVASPRPADLRDHLHRFDRFEELHADRDRAESQIPIEAVDDRVPVVCLHATLPRRGLTNYSALVSTHIRTRASARSRGAHAWWAARSRARAVVVRPGAGAAAPAASSPRRAPSRPRPILVGRRSR